MKMIVGLGNIGREYANTRHNIGFMALDELAGRDSLTFKQDGPHHAYVADWRVGMEKVLLVKPTTYMNESGVAVRALADYYDIDLADILIVHDDMDLDLGKLRLRQKGSAGGHNGLKSIAKHMGGLQFNRLKFGISHPQHSAQAVIDFVLGKFTPDEMPAVNLGIDASIKIFEDFAKGADMPTLMNQHN